MLPEDNCARVCTKNDCAKPRSVYTIDMTLIGRILFTILYLSICSMYVITNPLVYTGAILMLFCVLRNPNRSSISNVPMIQITALKLTQAQSCHLLPFTPHNHQSQTCEPVCLMTSCDHSAVYPPHWLSAEHCTLCTELYK